MVAYLSAPPLHCLTILLIPCGRLGTAAVAVGVGAVGPHDARGRVVRVNRGVVERRHAPRVPARANRKPQCTHTQTHNWISACAQLGQCLRTITGFLLACALDPCSQVAKGRQRSSRRARHRLGSLGGCKWSDKCCTCLRVKMVDPSGCCATFAGLQQGRRVGGHMVERER